MSIGLIDQDCLNNKKDFYYDLDIMKIGAYYKSKKEITKLLLIPSEYTQYTKTFFVKNRYDYKSFDKLFKDDRIAYRGYAFYGEYLEPLPEEIEKTIPDPSIYSTYLKFNENIADRRWPYLKTLSNYCLTRLSKDGENCNTPADKVLYKDSFGVCLYDFNIFDLKDWREGMKIIDERTVKLRFPPITDSMDDIKYLFENFNVGTENHVIYGKTIENQDELDDVIETGRIFKDNIRIQLLKDLSKRDKAKAQEQINYAVNLVLGLKHAKTRIHSWIDQHDITEKTVFLNNISYWCNRNHSNVSLSDFMHRIRKSGVDRFDRLAMEDETFKHLYNMLPSEWEGKL